jgi:hypothetical protein
MSDAELAKEFGVPAKDVAFVRKVAIKMGYEESEVIEAAKNAMSDTSQVGTQERIQELATEFSAATKSVELVLKMAKASGISDEKLDEMARSEL